MLHKTQRNLSPAGGGESAIADSGVEFCGRIAAAGAHSQPCDAGLLAPFHLPLRVRQNRVTPFGKTQCNLSPAGGGESAIADSGVEFCGRIAAAGAHSQPCDAGLRPSPLGAGRRTGFVVAKRASRRRFFYGLSASLGFLGGVSVREGRLAGLAPRKLVWAGIQACTFLSIQFLQVWAASCSSAILAALSYWASWARRPSISSRNAAFICASSSSHKSLLLCVACASRALSSPAMWPA